MPPNEKRNRGLVMHRSPGQGIWIEIVDPETLLPRRVAIVVEDYDTRGGIKLAVIEEPVDTDDEGQHFFTVRRQELPYLGQCEWCSSFLARDFIDVDHGHFCCPECAEDADDDIEEEPLEHPAITALEDALDADSEPEPDFVNCGCGHPFSSFDASLDACPECGN